jgi:hypothetical protein
MKIGMSVRATKAARDRRACASLSAIVGRSRAHGIHR